MFPDRSRYEEVLETSLYPSSDRLISDLNSIQSQLEISHAQLDSTPLLTKTALRICNFLSPLEILKAMVTEVQHLLNVERVVVYRFQDDNNGELLVESALDHLSSLSRHIRADDDVDRHWFMACQKGQIHLTSDIYEGKLSPKQVEWLESSNIRAHLAIPIVHNPKVVQDQSYRSWTDNRPNTCDSSWGVMSVQHCSAPRQWQWDEVEFLKKLMSHVTIALHQAELYVAVRTAMRRHQNAQVKAHQLNVLIQKQLMEHMVQLETSNQRLIEEIDKRNQLEERLFQEKELAQVTLKSIGDAVITTDVDGRVQSMNPVAENLTGWMSEQAQGQSLENIFHIVDEEKQKRLQSPARDTIESGQTISLPSHTILISKDGNEYMIENSASPILNRDQQIIGAVLVFHDVTKSRQLEKMLSWQATHDPLTGLANRREFEHQVTAAIEFTRTNDKPFALCYLDLDRFKVINDTCGHLAGDQLLQQITSVLQQRIRTSDTLARLGGDEFGLILHHCSIVQAQKITEDLVNLIQEHQFIWEGRCFQVGVSIGVVEIDQTFNDLLTVLSVADAACYKAKKLGGNNVQVSVSLAPNQGKNKHYWVGQVHSAIEEERLQLYSQKITALTQTSDSDMSEVLLRFINEEGKLLLPESLILAAEEFHLTRSIDQWVVQTFCEAYNDQTQYNPLLYTINLSGESINNVPFTQFLVDQIQKNNVPPDRICFEITETAAIENLAKASELIHSVKQLGCRFALDDFGSGMSSLAYLKALPVDYLKIDGAFIQHLASNSIDYSIVECFNRLSHDMGMKTIAEWVEDEPTLQKLKVIGVDYVQGYGISRPSPLLLL